MMNFQKPRLSTEIVSISKAQIVNLNILNFQKLRLPICFIVNNYFFRNKICFTSIKLTTFISYLQFLSRYSLSFNTKIITAHFCSTIKTIGAYGRN